MNKQFAPEPKSMFVDRQAVLRALAEHNAAVGFVPDNSATVQEIRARMALEGIRAEDNEGTREMIALRYPDEEV